MSIPFSGSKNLGIGIASAISKQLKAVNLQGVQRITVKFDPFHEQVTSTRNFLYYISSPKVALRSPNCSVRTDIVCDRQDPSVTFKLVPEIAELAGTNKVTVKSLNLSVLEILQIINKHITPLAPKEQKVSVLATKSEKKKAGTKR